MRLSFRQAATAACGAGTHRAVVGPIKQTLSPIPAERLYRKNGRYEGGIDGRLGQGLHCGSDASQIVVCKDASAMAFARLNQSALKAERPCTRIIAAGSLSWLRRCRQALAGRIYVRILIS
jgi:hypothetical protein